MKTDIQASDRELDDDVEPVDGSLDNDEIALLAYHFWEQRGCPDGSSEHDWFAARQELTSRKMNGHKQVDGEE